MEDKSYGTALRTQSKVGCIEQVTSGTHYRRTGDTILHCYPKKCHVDVDNAEFDRLSASWTLLLNADHKDVINMLYDHHAFFVLLRRRNAERLRAFLFERVEVV